MKIKNIEVSAINDTTLKLVIPFIEPAGLTKIAVINKYFQTLMATKKYHDPLSKFKKEHLREIVEIRDDPSTGTLHIDRESKLAAKINSSSSFEAFKKKAEKLTLHYKFVCRNDNSPSAAQNINENINSLMARVPIDGSTISVKKIKFLLINGLKELEESPIRSVQETVIKFLREEIIYLNRTMKEACDLRLVYLSNADPILSHPNTSFYATKDEGDTCTCTGPYKDRFSYGPCFFKTQKENTHQEMPQPPAQTSGASTGFASNSQT